MGVPQKIIHLRIFPTKNHPAIGVPPFIADWWFQPLRKILVNGKDYPIWQCVKTLYPW